MRGAPGHEDPGADDVEPDVDDVEAFVRRETKASGWDTFSKLLKDIRAYRARDVERDGASVRALADGDPDARLPVGSGYVDGVNALADERSPRLAPDWPLLTFGLEDDASAATDGDEGEEGTSGSLPPRRTSFAHREHAERHARRVQGLHSGGVTSALGYSRTELATLGNVEKRRAFREVHKNPSKCLKHFCTPGRVWEGTISIPGSGAVEESHGSPYALQVLWFDAAAGAFLISHTAQGDEQLCHLMLKDDGREGVMALSFSDNETYCSGSIDGETGVIRGTVGQLVRAEEGFFEESDSSRNTFELVPIDIDEAEGRDEPMDRRRRLQIARVLQRRKLVSQWSRSANILGATYSAIQFVKDTMRSEHMWAYMLRKLTFETRLMEVNDESVCSNARNVSAAAHGDDPVEDKHEGDVESLEEIEEIMLPVNVTLATWREENSLWMSFPSPALSRTVIVEDKERDWCDIWTLERMNAEFLGCKFRLYTRLLRARVFQTIKEKQTYLSEFKTLRSECHNEMNRVLNNMNLLLWRLFYGSELRGNDRQALVKNMVGILRVEEARMIIAYDNVDKALRECDARIPLDAIKQRCSIASKDSHVCSICLLDIEQGEEVLTLDCSHSFHIACCSTWLHTHATCPNCRSPQSTAASQHAATT